MSFSLAIGLKLYGPLILSIIFLIAVFLIRSTEQRTVINLTPFGQFFEFKIPVSNLTAIRLALSVAAILSLLSMLLIDFSSFFPKHLKMEVFLTNME